jgi:hypothetical protein
MKTQEIFYPPQLLQLQPLFNTESQEIVQENETFHTKSCAQRERVAKYHHFLGYQTRKWQYFACIHLSMGTVMKAEIKTLFHFLAESWCWRSAGGSRPTRWRSRLVAFGSTCSRELSTDCRALPMCCTSSLAPSALRCSPSSSNRSALGVSCQKGPVASLCRTFSMLAVWQ